jgi:CHAD domain-containing protein
MKTERLDLSITFGDYAHQIMLENFQQFIDQEEDVLDDADPEPLHQMRVGMRRFRTAIQVFSAALILPNGVDNSSIGRIARRLGKTRDLDVLKQDLERRYQPSLAIAEQLQFQKALKRLHQVRAKSFRDLKETINGDRYQTLKRSIKTCLAQSRYQLIAGVPLVQVLPDLLLPLVCQLFLHPGWLVGTSIQLADISLTSSDDAEELRQHIERISPVLHDLRKRVKEVRYQTEFFSPFYEASYGGWIEEFKTIQDLLGQLQDQVVQHQFLETVLRTNLDKGLPSVNEIMRQDQILFWQSWQSIQQRYLSPEVRQSLRSLLTHPLALAPQT